MSLIKDIFDKGAANVPGRIKSLKDYLTLIVAFLSLVASLNKTLIEFLTQYQLVFPAISNFVPLVLLLVIFISALQIVTAKTKYNQVIKYKYFNSARQASKLLALLALVSIGFNIFFLIDKLKPLDKPMILFVKTEKGVPVVELTIRVFDENKKDITQGIAETSTENGMALITSQKAIKKTGYIKLKIKNETQFIPISQLQKADTLVFNLPAYYLTIDE